MTMNEDLKKWFFETAYAEADNELNDIGHTPGPWVRRTDGEGTWIETEEGAAICWFPHWLTEVGSRPVQNSILAKHGPEMYALLHKIMIEEYTRHGAAAVYTDTYQLASNMVEKIREEIEDETGT